MGGIERNGHEELTLLELLLHLEGTIRRRLAPIRVTPLQAGALPCRGQTDGRRCSARREAANNEYRGEKSCTQALD